MTRLLQPLHLAALLALLLSVPGRAQDTERPRILVISVDGLQGAAIDREGLREFAPNLADLRTGGRAWVLQTGTPALTHPGHVTLISGRDPQDHGVLFNEFDTGCLCATGRPDRTPDYADWLPEAAARSGLRVASFGWAEIHRMSGIDPNVPFDSRIPDAERENDAALTDRVVEEIRRGAADLVFSYLASLDHVEHGVGPLLRPDGTWNDEAAAALRVVDAHIGRLVQAARETWGDRARVAVVSDHGFTTSCGLCGTCRAIEEVVRRGAARLRCSGCGPDRCCAGSCTHEDCSIEDRVYYVSSLGMIALFAPRGIPVEDLDRREAEIRAALQEGYTLFTGGRAQPEGGEIHGFLLSVHPPEGHAFGRMAGAHGHAGGLPAMRASFILWGTGEGATGEGRQRDVAPTLAGLLGGIDLPCATGTPLWP